MTLKFETLVIFNDEDIIDVIYGQNSELLKSLHKHEVWETIQEELDDQGKLDDINNINDLNLIHKSVSMDEYTIKVKLFENQSYHNPKKTTIKMKKLLLLSFTIIMFASCKQVGTADEVAQNQQEQSLKEASEEVGMPAITNFQEKKNLKWIYELCDNEKLICYVYLFDSMHGCVGQYLGECIGYGIPYSTQYSNPDKLIEGGYYSSHWGTAMPQAEPNGLFKPTGLSATWLIMIDPVTKKPTPVYLEPEIIVSPFKLK